MLGDGAVNGLSLGDDAGPLGGGANLRFKDGGARDVIPTIKTPRKLTIINKFVHTTTTAPLINESSISPT